MTTITLFNILAYILAALFIAFIIHSGIKEIRLRKRDKKLLKTHKEYEKNEKQLKQKGLKKFTFNNGNTIVWAANFKAANLQYQTSRKNGM